jgi:hypothetical protein
MKGSNFQKNRPRFLKPGSIDWTGQEYLGMIELAEGIVLYNCRMRIEENAGETTKRLSGEIRLLDCKNVEAGGFLDTEIISVPENPERIYLGTLVKNAYLNIGKNFRLQGGTIRFEYCSKPHESGKPLPYGIDEMDELLFQSTDPLPLGALYITGVGGTSITMSMTINALSSGNVRAFISLYPASIRVPVFGENTHVFLSGEARDNTVEIDVINEWSAFISTSPHLHLVNPSEPAGPSLVEGSCLLTGRLECRGFSSARLSLSSYLNYAKAFPQSPWPQELPYQKISFSVSEAGVPEMALDFNPIAIDGFLMYCSEEKNKTLRASLCENGLFFKGTFLVSQEHSTEPPRTLPEFLIDNHCRVWVDPGHEKIELNAWFLRKII